MFAVHRDKLSGCYGASFSDDKLHATTPATTPTTKPCFQWTEAEYRDKLNGSYGAPFGDDPTTAKKTAS